MLVRRHTRDEKSGLVNKLGALPLPLRVNGIDYRALSISIFHNRLCCAVDELPDVTERESDRPSTETHCDLLASVWLRHPTFFAVDVPVLCHVLAHFFLLFTRNAHSEEKRARA